MFILGIFFIHFFALLVPGPDSLLVSRAGLTGRTISIIQVALGITTSTFIWVLLSLLGLHILFQYYPILNKIILLIGSCYLFYLAYMIYRYSGNTRSDTSVIQSKSYFLNGLICNLSNPKAILYFSSIFSTISFGDRFIDTAAIIATVVIETFVCFVGLGFVFAHPRIKKWYHQYTQKIDIASALIFTIFASIMLLELLI